MVVKFEKEFREAHPETIGEKDSHFDLSNYADWLETLVEEKFTSTNSKSMPCEHKDNIYIERNDKGYHFCFDCLTVY